MEELNLGQICYVLSELPSQVPSKIDSCIGQISEGKITFWV